MDKQRDAGRVNELARVQIDCERARQSTAQRIPDLRLEHRRRGEIQLTLQFKNREVAPCLAAYDEGISQNRVSSVEVGSRPAWRVLLASGPAFMKATLERQS